MCDGFLLCYTYQVPHELVRARRRQTKRLGGQGGARWRRLAVVVVVDEGGLLLLHPLPIAPSP